MNKERYKILQNLHDAEGKLAYMLAVFGDTLAKREGYKELDGMAAIHFYIVHKFKWLPSQVKSMSAEDLRFVLSEEMSGWTAPAEAR
ncbi:hypothetical protein G2912_13955 [Paraburkholderia aspalathi]|jgi:hypothetical protein|uniref:Uncharacterized protein n=1 Tax=Paraburkholderia nemoris TaxID=2793076 RepID=A0ABM8RM72_9BURK|nr:MULTISPECIES: hypothetical protein [Paraburkholderia]MBK3811458.1 hypothetical protein [Paraburkholderia aspalathi]CAE6760768.1 hypothetical protein R69776_03360 [Paraburkholderia nemoris]